jgi:CBS domain containing-hemolysin-like protein
LNADPAGRAAITPCLPSAALPGGPAPAAHDGADGRVTRRGDGWVLPGDIHLDEAQRLLDERLPDGDYETIAGLLMHQLGRLPAVGDSVDIPLPDDPAAWPAKPKVLSANVRSVERRVPAEVFVAIRYKEDCVE